MYPSCFHFHSFHHPSSSSPASPSACLWASFHCELRAMVLSSRSAVSFAICVMSHMYGFHHRTSVSPLLLSRRHPSSCIATDYQERVTKAGFSFLKTTFASAEVARHWNGSISASGATRAAASHAGSIVLYVNVCSQQIASLRCTVPIYFFTHRLYAFCHKFRKFTSNENLWY